MELRRQGRIAEARLKLISLYELLGDSEEDQNLAALLNQMIVELASEKSPERLDFVKAALRRADEHLENGKVERAVAIWFSVKQLYDADPDAASLVNQAEVKYFKTTGIQLLGKGDLPIPKEK